MSLAYRPEIDGLRAISVLFVLAYHADLPFFGQHGFRGGFLGVDIFFVISGYLITANLLREMNEGTFSFASFYERRSRRILPVLFFVMLFAIPGAWWLMFPEPFKNFMLSLLAASFSVANIFFA